MNKAERDSKIKEVMNEFHEKFIKDHPGCSEEDIEGKFRLEYKEGMEKAIQKTMEAIFNNL